MLATGFNAIMARWRRCNRTQMRGAAAALHSRFDDDCFEPASDLWWTDLTAALRAGNTPDVAPDTRRGTRPV
jgi:hypothetical protein